MADRNTNYVVDMHKFEIKTHCLLLFLSFLLTDHFNKIEFLCCCCCCCVFLNFSFTKKNNYFQIKSNNLLLSFLDVCLLNFVSCAFLNNLNKFNTDTNKHSHYTYKQSYKIITINDSHLYVCLMHMHSIIWLIDRLFFIFTFILQ